MKKEDERETIYMQTYLGGVENIENDEHGYRLCKGWEEGKFDGNVRNICCHRLTRVRLEDVKGECRTCEINKSIKLHMSYNLTFSLYLDVKNGLLL